MLLERPGRKRFSLSTYEGVRELQTFSPATCTLYFSEFKCTERSFPLKTLAHDKRLKLLKSSVFKPEAKTVTEKLSFVCRICMEICYSSCLWARNLVYHCSSYNVF